MIIVIFVVGIIVATVVVFDSINAIETVEMPVYMRVEIE